jgi:hypothetical protein
MAKKSTPAKSVADKAEIAKKPVTKSVAAPVSTPVRNTPIPKVSVVKKEITYEQIAKRAFEIHCSGQGGSETDNWHRAERELRSL